jgi:uncharacterized cysteine cluster protein YcgN (CxxCxxCC family)
MENDNQQARLEQYFEAKERESETLCARCGSCCGAHDGDPCEHLKTDGRDAYLCDIYDSRLGNRKTVSGREFECVDIKEVLASGGWPKNPECGYI